MKHERIFIGKFYLKSGGVVEDKIIFESTESRDKFSFDYVVDEYIDKVRSSINFLIEHPVSYEEEDEKPYGDTRVRRTAIYKYIEFGYTKIPAANVIAATIAEVINDNPYKVFTI